MSHSLATISENTPDENIYRCINKEILMKNSPKIYRISNKQKIKSLSFRYCSPNEDIFV